MVKRIKRSFYLNYQKYYYKRRTKKIVTDGTNDVIFLFGTPEHGNLGDHAIALAEKNFLNTYFPSYKIFEITGDHFRFDIEGITKKITHKDKIILTGGGFLGNIWEHEDKIVNMTIQLFPENKIIIFPQTIYYEDSEDKRQKIEESKRIYQNHKNLHVLTRDRQSFDFIKKNICGGYFDDCQFVPDIALFLRRFRVNKNRNIILKCLRNDKEKNVNVAEISKIDKYIQTTGLKVENTSTVINKKVYINKREKEVLKKLKEFTKAKIVITDRLHGMIFSAISETPCIAINNSSKKIQGVHHWLEHLDYIYFAKSIEEIPFLISNLLEKDHCTYSNKCLEQKFKEIASVVQQ